MKQPVDDQPLALSEIQGLVLHGYGKRPCARYAMFRIDDPKLARKWLWQLVDRTQFSEFLASGEDEAPYLNETCLNVAFTYAGLELLGLCQQALFGFSSAFREGMASTHRSRQLGDDGDSAPEKWTWGGPGTPTVHGVLLVYGGTGEGDEAEDLSCGTAIERELTSAHGVSLIAMLDTRPMCNKDARREHFGFRDGISNPKLSGLNKRKQHDEIPSGEVVLGYRNAYGICTQTPELSAEDDEKNLLPQSQNADDRHDFGKNGSYLVFRQLEQDVAKFWQFLDRAVKTLPSDHSAVWLGARMVGRWPSGAPVTQYPGAEDPGGAHDTNAFLFHEHDDAFGTRCPIGSHIRRSNPRDTMLPMPHDVALSEDASDDKARKTRMAATNRHRILRRGRIYGDPLSESFAPHEMRDDDGKKRGLHFLCFNSNLRRQFEFVQATWIVNPIFAGLSSDPDPILAARRSVPFDASDFTLPGCPVRQVENVERFVETRGGAYFFVPSRSALRYLGCVREPEITRAGDPEQSAGTALRDLHLGKVERDYATQAGSRKHARRGFHAKAHGIVRATCEIDADLPHAFQAGVFVAGARYPAWVRFSSGSFLPKPDSVRDVHGLAIKLMGVPKGARAAEFERHTQDFLLIDAPRLMVRDAEEALDFDRAQNEGKLAFIRHLFMHPEQLTTVLAITSTPEHPLERVYNSVAPFAHGAGRVVRYVVRRAASQSLSEVEQGPDMLRRALALELRRGSVKLELCVQVRGSRGFSLDDGSCDWGVREERVATLTLHADGFGSPEQEALGERMSFNPWNTLEAHRPLGSLNQARRIVYRAVYELRSKLNGAVPFEPSAE